jgi:hypothetical protein
MIVVSIARFMLRSPVVMPDAENTAAAASGTSPAPLRHLIRPAQERQQTATRESAEDIDQDRKHSERHSAVEAKERYGNGFEILDGENQRREGE